MGQKVHPIGFRIGVIRGWQAKWYADKNYADLLQEDLMIRQALRTKYPEAGISTVEIERGTNEITLKVHTARPGIVIGRGGQRVDEMRLHLEKITGKRVRLNIQEIRQPELDAYLVAKNITEQIVRRISHRRAMKQAISRTMQAGALGIKVLCSGRLAGAEIARREKLRQGRVPLHTLRSDIDYGFAEAHVTVGLIGVKVWIYKGDVLPPAKEEEPEALQASAIAVKTEEEGAEGIEEIKGEVTDVTTETSEIPQEA